jgi:pimeloyl-ACP methyl ester carboxylesterase
VSLPLERKRIGLSVGEMAYVDMGDGPPVLLLHGFPTSADLWRREAWLIAQRMRVIAPDLIGYGESDKPAEADLTEPAQAGYVRELLEALGINEVAIVGHDIGGAIAQMLALDGPLRVHALVLLDPACFDAWPVEGVRMIQAVLPEQETAPFVEEILREAFVVGIAHQSRIEPGVVDGYVEPWKQDPAAFFRAARGLSGKGLAGRDDDLAGLDVPALIIWGEDDPYLPAELAERLGDAIPLSTVALLPGCSHYVTEDAPQTVGPLVYEFLRLRYLGESHGHGPPTGPVRVFLERPNEGVD